MGGRLAGSLWTSGRKAAKEEEMPNASQVPDPEGVIIHANEFGLHSKYTIMQAGNLIRLALECSF